MSPIMPWILYAIIPNVQLDHYEYPGETACKKAIEKIVVAVGGPEAVKKGSLTLVCIPRGEPDYTKMLYVPSRSKTVNKEHINQRKTNNYDG